MATANSRTRAVRTLVMGGAVAVGGAIGFGVISVSVSPWIAGLAFAVFAAIAYGVASSGDQVSVTFGLSLAAVLVLLLEYVVPQSIVGMLPIAPFLGGLDAAQFALLAGITIVFWWVIDVRFLSGRAKNPDTVAKRVASRMETLVEQYFSIGKIAFTFGIVVGLLFLNTFVGPVLGELGSIAAEVPYLVANLATILLGYVSMGGDVPFLNAIPFVREIGAQGFLWIAVAVLLVAVGVDYAD